jgi:arylsulfatase A-like enzyme
MNVHGPYMADEHYRARFREEPSLPFEFRSRLWEDIMSRGCAKCREQVKPEHLRDLRARYDGAIARTDEVLGGFLDELRARGHLDRAIVVVTSDHGEELFDHGGFDHGKSLHGEVVDVPLLIRPPGGTNGRRVATPVSLVDVPATLLDLLGLEGDGSEPRRVGDGLSLASFVRGEPASSSLKDRVLSAEIDVALRAKAFLLQVWPLRAITTWKDYRGRRDHFEIFDVVRDPEERVDLAPQRPDLRRRLSAMTADWRARLDAGRMGPGAPVEPSPALRERLEALGYVEEEVIVEEDVIGGDAIEQRVEDSTEAP